MNAKIVIGIACHKPFEMPDNELYLPINVGAALRDAPLPGTQPDDQGDNISELNPYYCELTAQYWLWKNVDADYYGMCHYRRFLSFADRRFDNLTEDNRGHVLITRIDDFTKEKYHLNDTDGMRSIIEAHDIVAPEQQDLRRVYTPRGEKNSVYAHFAAHDGDLINVDDLDQMISIVHAKYPQYADDLDEYISKPFFRGFNCFVMNRDLFFELCEYEFDVLAELESHIDLSTYDITRSRVYGFMAEIISSAFMYHVEKRRQARVCDVQMLYFQSTDPFQSLRPWDDSLTVVIDMVKTRPFLFAPLARSLIDHLSPERRYDIIVVHTEEMTAPYIAEYRRMFSGSPNTRLSFLDWNIEARALEDRIESPEALGTSTQCAIAWILGHHDRAIVLSASTLVEKGWDAIAACDLQENLAGATKDVFRIGLNNNLFHESYRFDQDFLGLKDPLSYFNTAAMVIDLHRMRSNVSLRDVAFVLTSFARELEPDEAANVIFENNVEFLDQSYNRFTTSEDSFHYAVADLPTELAKSYGASAGHARIISFNAMDPFWPNASSHAIEYWELARRTALYECLLAFMVRRHIRDGRGGEAAARKVFDLVIPVGSKRRDAMRKLLPWNSTAFVKLRSLVRSKDD